MWLLLILKLSYASKGCDKLITTRLCKVIVTATFLISAYASEGYENLSVK